MGLASTIKRVGRFLTITKGIPGTVSLHGPRLKLKTGEGLTVSDIRHLVDIAKEVESIPQELWNG